MNIDYKLSEDWNQTSKVVLFGFGERAKNNIEIIKKYYEIICILDSNKEKCGNKYNDIDVKWINEADKEIKEHKIIIMSTANIASDMAKQLSKYGLVEYKDFCRLEEWLFENEWKRNRKLYLPNINTSIISRCTLKCKNCCMLVPYHKKEVEYTIFDFQYNIDLLFNYIDYVGQINIMGGEPLLNKDLEEMLEWICLKYKEKMGKIIIDSNGTVLPSKNLLKICSQYKAKIAFAIGDYTDEVPYKARLNEVLALLKESEIEYQTYDYLTYEKLQWRDMGFPAYNYPVQKGKEREHMLSCNPCNTLNDGKFYYCQSLWIANRCGLYNEKEEDYVDLKSLSKETGKLDIIRFCRGEISSKKGFMNLCAICGGFGPDNDKFVKAGIQI